MTDPRRAVTIPVTAAAAPLLLRIPPPLNAIDPAWTRPAVAASRRRGGVTWHRLTTRYEEDQLTEHPADVHRLHSRVAGVGRHAYTAQLQGGLVVQCHPLLSPTPHARGVNTSHLALALIGDYRAGRDRLSDRDLDVGARVTAAWLWWMGRGVEGAGGHDELPGEAGRRVCPGPGARLPELRAATRYYLELLPEWPAAQRTAALERAGWRVG